MYQYNPDTIQASIAARARIRKTCRKIVTQYAPMLPESVIRRICTRRKLWNFLDALELSAASIQSIFWSHNLPVPRDHELKPAAMPKPETKPAWLCGAPLDSDSDSDSDSDIFF